MSFACILGIEFCRHRETNVERRKEIWSTMTEVEMASSLLSLHKEADYWGQFVS